MNSIVIDTNPLIYIYHDAPDFGRDYAVLLGRLVKKNALIIPKIVYGELSLAFENEKELNEFLSDTGIIIGEMKPESYVIAAKRWEAYNKRRVLMCPKCGKKLGKIVCRNCDSEIKMRQHILSDFLIGAYAFQMEGSNLVTNDGGYFSTYFPELNIITASKQVPPLL
jgi:predicted nucleic acid-binding protein